MIIKNACRLYSVCFQCALQLSHWRRPKVRTNEFGPVAPPNVPSEGGGGDKGIGSVYHFEISHIGPLYTLLLRTYVEGYLSSDATDSKSPQLL